MAAKLSRLTLKVAIRLHLVVESCTICSSNSRPPVRKLLVTLSYSYSLHLMMFLKCFHMYKNRYFDTFCVQNTSRDF